MGHPYQYNEPGRTGPFEVICLGADGKEGDSNISSDDLDVTASADAVRHHHETNRIDQPVRIHID